MENTITGVCVQSKYEVYYMAIDGLHHFVLNKVHDPQDVSDVYIYKNECEIPYKFSDNGYRLRFSIDGCVYRLSRENVCGEGRVMGYRNTLVGIDIHFARSIIEDNV